MKKYQKKQLIEVLKVLENGDVYVQNEGQPNDKWVIPKEVFESTYVEVIE